MDNRIWLAVDKALRSLKGIKFWITSVDPYYENIMNAIEELEEAKKIGEKKMKYEYIIDRRGFYVVPWADTRAAKDKRDNHFSKKFGVRPLIVSPDMWEVLLCSYELHTFKVEEK